MTRALALYHLHHLEERNEALRPLPLEPYRPDFIVIPDPDWRTMERRRLTANAFGLGFGAGIALGTILLSLVTVPPL
jgi:hypothetical protein